MKGGYDKVLIVSMCSEWLHHLEFVKPIEDIMKSLDIKYFVRNYEDLDVKDLDKASKIILSGTSLSDGVYLNNIKDFSFLKKINKPVLGICSGMQTIGLVFDGKLNDSEGIGLTKIKFTNDFLDIKKGNELEVYELHNLSIKLDNKDFIISSAKDNIIYSFRHKSKPIYGVLFHPEVRNKELIKSFVSLKQ